MVLLKKRQYYVSIQHWVLPLKLQNKIALEALKRKDTSFMHTWPSDWLKNVI